MLFRHVVFGLVAAAFAAASSVTRNPLRTLGDVRNPSIHTSTRHITAFSRFELSFDAVSRRIKLTLEPNHDILASGPSINYLGDDGSVVRTEPIDRLSVKVFKGDAWWLNLDGTWSRVGWARILVHEDGETPMFEGTFTIHHDHHHIQLASNYRTTKHQLDPHPQKDDEHMVVFRDSDIQADNAVHLDLKRSVDRDHDVCQSDLLDFNMDPAHPVYAGTGKDAWGMPLSNVFGKRQLDTSTGSGNTGGVNLVTTIGLTQGCPNTRKIALVGVAYDCSYANSFNSTETVKKNVIAQMNSASNLYEQTFNITLGLANLTANDAQCPATAPSSAPWNVPCSGNVDIQDRLNLFSAWRSQKIDNNSHWTLLTNCNTGSVVGLAWLGQACVTGENSETRNATGGQQVVSGANVVARTSTEWQVIA